MSTDEPETWLGNIEKCPPGGAREAVARALYARDAAAMSITQTWDELGPSAKAAYLAEADTALTAASPIIAAEIRRYGSPHHLISDLPRVTGYRDAMCDLYADADVIASRI